MRIAITGTYSVGKTTFINDLHASLENKKKKVIIINEVARTLIKRGFKITPLTEFGIINYIKEYLEIERETEGDIIISDRSLLDLLSYITVDNSPLVRKVYLDLIKEVWLMEKERFDVYLHLPIEFELEQDGARSPDEKYRKAVDRQILDFIKIYNLKHITIRGSRTQRVNAAIMALRL